MSANTPAALAPMPGAEAFIQNGESAPAYWMQNILWIILADAQQTGGRWSMMEQLLPKGSGPPPHAHIWSDETFYILDGNLTFLIGDDIRMARPGDFVMVPRDTRHGFRIDSDTARFLNGYIPASIEALVAELGTPALERVLPPNGPAPSGMKTPEQRRRYGLQWLQGPDPLRSNGH